MKAAAEGNPDRRIELWFMDEARVGQKGRVGFRWWARGERPRGLRQLGYEWAHLFGAVRPATGDGFALVLPEVSAAAMQAFLDCFATGLADGARAASSWTGPAGIARAAWSCRPTSASSRCRPTRPS